VHFPHVFSSDPTQTYAQGAAEGASAIQAASNLGMNLPAIYYDMEQYNSSQCGAAVQNFVSGWTNTMEGFGKSGVYGAPADAQNDWLNSAPQPQNVWIAKLGTNSPATPMVTTWGLSPLLDSRWNTNPGSRIRQYLENQSVTFGGVNAPSIDENIEYAEIVPGWWEGPIPRST
jgi:hypothetical protein